MYKYLLSFIVLAGLFLLWSYLGIAQTGIHADLARDLNELSNIWIGKIVWLGPMTSANFHASPLYYYLLFPGLVLSGGNGLSLIPSHAFFAALALGLFACFQLKKTFLGAILVILAIGLSRWWIDSSSFPWNGHMYVSWVFLGLTGLWFKKPLFLSALLFGISIAIDLAAILALPVLFYEWWVREKRLKNLIFLLLGLLLPWTPIILFEIITKGYLSRQWLQHPSSAGLTYSWEAQNITRLLNTLGVSRLSAAVIWLATFFIGSKREKFWLLFISLPLIFLMLISQLRLYYTLGLICALTFIVFTVWSSKTIGKIVLAILILTYAQTINLPSFSTGGRSIQRLSGIVNTLVQNNLDLTKKYAVVSLIDLQNSTPQADDYRFFLRIKGVEVLGIDQYPKADRLLLFVEVPNFDWQTFEDWHIRQFGSRKFLSNLNINGIEIIMYGRN